MFESDDYDQILSQFDIPEDGPLKPTNENEQFPKSILLNIPKTEEQNNPECQNVSILNNANIPALSPAKLSDKSINKRPREELTDNFENVSPKHTKRKIINSYFDHQSKRKFPGPAGLLTGDFEDSKDESICQMELLSQDVDFSQNHLRSNLFESPLWLRLLDDLKSWNLNEVDPIKTIKQQAQAGIFRRRKAHVITAFVETVDRSAIDPLIRMRDTTGSIKGTLHRDAWTTFSQYIAAEYCAFILWKPTILTTGSAFKKHYLNITLSNILAIYSSAVLNDDNVLPKGYVVVNEDDYTVIKTEKCAENIGNKFTFSSELENGAVDLLDGLDNIFTDDVF